MRSVRRQEGAVMPLLAGAMVVLVGIAGLALDLGHAYSTKSELQNVLDSAALSGAKVLMQTDSTDQAQAAALETFAATLPNGLADLAPQPAVEFSDTLIPFAPGGIEPRYIRVSVPQVTLDTWFAQVLPGVGDQLSAAGSAVAGPQPLNQACESVMPMVVCARDLSDTENWGFTTGEQEEMLAAGSQSSRDVGSGNFQLLALGCTGGSCLRENLDDGYGGCIGVDDTVTTEPGVNVGPVFQGLNIRFGIQQGPTDGDPDVVTEWRTVAGENDFWFDEYLDRSNNGPHDELTGRKWRRILPIPIAECTGEDDGRTTDLVIRGLKCFFLTRPANHDGQRTVNGQFIGNCETLGSEAAPWQEDTSQPYKIILFKDNDSIDS